MQIVNLSPEKIKPDPNQPRQTFDEEKIKDMAQSIKTEGIINAIEIDKDYIIITGEMRWRASKLAGLKVVPCKIININPKERFRRQVVENIHNMTMNPWDTAQALQKLLSVAAVDSGFGHWNDVGIAKLSREIGMKDSTVREYLRLLEASPEFQTAIKEGKVIYSFNSIINRAPKEWQAPLEQRLLSGEFKRDEARELLAALKRNPEKGEELLKADISQFRKIAPSATDIVHNSFKNINELSATIDKLLEWLKINSPESIGAIHAFRIILNFKVLADAINNWGKEFKQLKE